MERNALNILVWVLLTGGIFCCSNCGEDPPPPPPEQCQPGTYCPCESSSDCPAGETCTPGGVCFAQGPDASPDVVDMPVDVLQDGAGDDIAEIIPELVDESADDSFNSDLPDCIDDAFDAASPNDSLYQAGHLTDGRAGSLRLCPGNVDWWRYVSAAHQNVTFMVEVVDVVTLERFVPGAAGEPHTVVETGVSTTGGFVITTAVSISETLYYRVSSESEVALNYAIEITPDPFPCDDDLFDLGGSPNDSRTTAAYVAMDDELLDDLVFCGSDGEQDWYAFDLLGLGYYLEISITFDGEALGGSLRGALYFESGTGQVGTGSALENEYRIDTSTSGALTRGRYYLGVLPSGSPLGPYAVSVTAIPLPNCLAFDTTHEPDNNETEALALGGGAIGFNGAGVMNAPVGRDSLVMCEEDTADVFPLPLGAKALVHFDITFTDPSDPINVWVYPEGEEPSETYEIPLVGDAYSFDYFSVAASDHFLRVERGLDRRRNAYTLDGSLSLCDLDAYEINNTPDAGFDLDPNNILDNINLDVLTMCDDDPEDWFYQHVPSFRSQEVRITNSSNQPLQTALFYAPIVRRSLQCTSEAGCEPTETCLFERGCAAAVVEGTVPASTGSPVFHTLVHDTFSNGGEYVVRVATTAAGDVDYAMRWAVSFACPVDEWGDSSESASVLSDDSGVLTGFLCNKELTIDEDFFSIPVADNSQLSVGLQFERGNRIKLTHVGHGLVGDSNSGVLTYVYRGSSSSPVTIGLLGLPAAWADSVVAYELAWEELPIPVSCESDGYEPNDTTSTPAPINGLVPWVDERFDVGNNLTICGTDQDYYQLTAQGGDVLVADAAFDATAGDLDLRLYGPCGESSCDTLIVSASVVGNREQLVRELPEDGRYVVGVIGKTGGLNQMYSLGIGVFSSCVNDSLEPNNVVGQATTPGPDGVRNLGLCASTPYRPDYDWFSYPLHNGDTLSMDLTFANYHGNIDVAVWRGNELAVSSTSTSDAESIELTVSEPGTHFVEIYAEDQQDNPYSIDIQLDAAPCDVDRMEPNDTWVDAPRIRPGYYTDLVRCHEDDDWYGLELYGGGALWIQLLAFPAVETDDLLLELYRPDQPPPGNPAWLITRSGSRFDAIVTDLPEDVSGEYLIRVFQREGVELSDQVEYALHVEIAPAGQCPPDAFQGNQSRLESHRLASVSAAAGHACATSDWYVVQGFQGQDIDVSLTLEAFNLDPPHFSLYLDSEGVPVGTYDTTATIELTENTDVYIEVIPAVSDSAYLLAVDVGAGIDACSGPDDSNEPDDAIGSAKPLTGTFSGILCDTDYFRFPAIVNQDIQVSLYYDSGWGHPILDIVSNGSGETVIGSGIPQGDGLLEAWATAPSSSLMFLRLLQSTPSYEGPYFVELQPPVACTDDGDSNNTIESATSVDGASLTGTLCPQGDVDFISFSVTPGDRIEVMAQQDLQDLRLRLYDHNQNLLMESNRSTPLREKETVWVVGGESSTLYVEVSGPTPQPAQYELFLIEQGPPAPSAVCIDAGTNRSLETAEEVPLDEELDPNPNVCSGVGDWYSTPAGLTPGDFLEITVEHDLDLADLDIELFNADGQTVDGAYTLQDTEELSFRIVDTQYWFRVVIDDAWFMEDRERASVSYDLTVEVH